MNSISPSIDVSFHIYSLLDDKTLRDLYVLGLIPELSQLVASQLWWHARVEVFTELQLVYQDQVDWEQVYLVLTSTMKSKHPRFWNKYDNSTVCEIMRRMGLEPLHNEFELAASYGSANILTWLISNNVSMSHPVYYTVDPLHCATREGQVEAVRLLLKYDKIDPTYDEQSNTALTLACRTTHRGKMNSYIQIVELLLQDGRVDPNYNQGAALNRAILENNSNLAAVLLSDSRTDPTLGCVSALQSALQVENTEAAMMLLADRRVLEDIKSWDLDSFLDIEFIPASMAELVRHAIRQYLA